MSDRSTTRRGRSEHAIIEAPRRASYWQIGFDLPYASDQVFRAWTDDALLARWMVGGFLKKVQFDPRPGGRWRYRFADGTERWEQRGTFTRFVPGSLIEATEDPSDGELSPRVSIITFSPTDGGAHVTYRSVYVDERARDRSVHAGYPDHVVQLFESLDAFLGREERTR